MSKITIRVEFLAGTDFRSAAAEAKEKADTWGVAYITFDFNGTRVSVSQKANIDDLYNEYITEPSRGFVVG